MKKIDKPKQQRKGAPQEAPEQLYGLTAVLVIVFTWLILTSILGGETAHPFLMIGVVLGLIYCINSLLSFGIKIEGVKDWVKVYYSLPTYMLITLFLALGTGVAIGPAAAWARSLTGLPPVTLGGFDTLGVSMLGLLLGMINIAYGITALIIGMARKHTRLKRTLFNIGLVLVFISCLLVSAAYINLVVSAPADGYPGFQF